MLPVQPAAPAPPLNGTPEHAGTPPPRFSGRTMSCTAHTAFSPRPGARRAGDKGDPAENEGSFVPPSRGDQVHASGGM